MKSLVKVYLVLGLTALSFSGCAPILLATGADVAQRLGVGIARRTG